MPPHAPLAMNTATCFCSKDDGHSTSSGAEETTNKPLTQQLQQEEHHQRKTVSFADFPEVKEIELIDDLKKFININDLWYTSKEYDEMLSDCIATVRCMDFGLPINMKEQCVRGVEKLTYWGIRAKASNVSNALYAVMQEQECQKREGIHDIELLADQYYDKSYQCQLDAHMMALWDRQEVLLSLWTEGCCVPPFMKHPMMPI